MYFKRIEMHGFKSFAEPVVIEFNRGITCIVGPNGSGKSNISDAIRWVLGEQSPKMLRGGKMEEVIFSGTASRKSRGMAEVTLVIDNEDGSLDIDYKEVAITRRMFRSGESEYRINGNQCRLRDIRDLIMDTGIGVDGYSIIGQGKISDILSNKTESRREIFEEAAGIVTYRTKKAESEKKLVSTNANMERISDIIGELQGRIDGLREDSVKAKEYLKLKDKHKKLEINITLKNIENLDHKNAYIKDDLLELQLSIDNINEKKAEIEGNLTQYNSRNEELENNSVETRQKLLAFIDELNSMVNKGQLDNQRLISIEDNTERLKNEIELLTVKKEKEQEDGRVYTAKKAELDKKLADVRDILKTKIGSFNDAAAELAVLTKKADQYKNDIFELSGAITSGKAEVNSLQRLQETLIKRQDVLILEKNTGESSNKESLDRLNVVKIEKAQIAEHLKDIKGRAAEQQRKLAADQSSEKELSKTVEQLRISLGQLSARMKTIQEMESNYEGYNYAVKHIMKSDLSGINGVVADLIKVPHGYETAIETALGAALQNIVCVDDNSAKRAIRSLKEHKAGRMTFLPLSSVKGKFFGDKRLEREKGFIGFGPDCLEYDKKYQDIIDYLLGRVVLVDNMDNAVKMSKVVSSFRFVTLDGEVINASGAITGGKYKSKTVNILDRKAEIGLLKQEISDKTENCRKQEVRLSELRESISSISQSLLELKEEIQHKEQQLLIKDNEVKLIENLLSDMKSAGDKLSRELENINAEKENSEKMILQIKSKIEENEIAIREAERLGQEQQALYESKKEAVDIISEEITADRISVSNCESENAHAASIVDRINTSVKEIEQEIISKKTQLEEIHQERDRIESERSHTAQIIKEKEDEKQRLEKYLSQITEEKTDISKKITDLNSEKESLDSKLNKVQNQKYELEIKNARNETQLDTYKNKLWEDFGVSYIQAMEFKSDEFIMSLAVKENRQVKSRINQLGEVNVGAIKEYETVKERYDFLMSQRDDIQEAVDGLNQIISDMDKTIKSKFKESFDQIVVGFQEKFRELFGGGHAKLRLSDEKNPLESNIDIVAQPPGKKLQNINLLSGGEKTLTAIALMFAVLKVKPTPFCILDEVEAALDDANIDRFINCLRRFMGIQFTLVTHQKATMEHADVLYGVTMPEKGVSKVLSLSLGDHFDI